MTDGRVDSQQAPIQMCVSGDTHSVDGYDLNSLFKDFLAIHVCYEDRHSIYHFKGCQSYSNLSDTCQIIIGVYDLRLD